MPLLPPRASFLASGRRVRHAHALAHARHPKAGAPGDSSDIRTLSVDIGGTGIKMIVFDAAGRPINDRTRFLTPQPATPRAVLDVIRQMLATQPRFDRMAVGFPGVVVRGVTQTAANLEPESWKHFPFASELATLGGTPVRVINDADLQGYGVVKGQGVELVLTLGTGLGSALFVDGHLVPNLELGHHPFKKGKTYEERVCDAEFRRLGKKEWSERVKEMLDQIQPIFNPALIYLGGGNAEHVRIELPANVQLFTNVDGLLGGLRVWDDPTSG
jgi:polyphosphate glucokinase